MYIIIINEIGNILDKTIGKKIVYHLWTYRKSHRWKRLRENNTTDHQWPYNVLRIIYVQI